MEQSQPGESGESGKPERPPVEPGVPQAGAVPETGPGGPPGAGGSGGAPGGPVKRRRSWKLVLLVVASVLGVLCSGTIGYGLWWYNEETKPDRSAPDLVVSNYLRAFLAERDELQTSLYVCENPQLDAMNAFRGDIENREKQYAISIRVSWSGLDTTDASGIKQVQTTIRRSISDGSESDKSTWRFAVVDEGGWRVCAAEKIS